MKEVSILATILQGEVRGIQVSYSSVFVNCVCILLLPMELIDIDTQMNKLKVTSKGSSGDDTSWAVGSR